MTALATTVAEVREATAAARRRGARVGFVPTMGALHAGHLSLIEAAREATEFLAVSLFVNPTQFGPTEDFEAYPRPLEDDLAACRNAGVDLVFAPSAAEMYPEGFATTVHVGGPLTETLCGAHRPGHFDGVATVVAKLVGIVGPCTAWFGEKDAQQLAVVRRLVRDLDLAVEVVAGPLVRDEDGLALSSRNRRLADEERAHARVLSRALLAARAEIEVGRRDAPALAAEVRQTIEAEPGVALAYAAAVDPDTLAPLERIEDKVLVAVAAHVGPVRLIDNILLRDLPRA